MILWSNNYVNYSGVAGGLDLTGHMVFPSLGVGNTFGVPSLGWAKLFYIGQRGNKLRVCQISVFPDKACRPFPRASQ